MSTLVIYGAYIPLIFLHTFSLDRISSLISRLQKSNRIVIRLVNASLLVESQLLQNPVILAVHHVVLDGDHLPLVVRAGGVQKSPKPNSHHEQGRRAEEQEFAPPEEN